MRRIHSECTGKLRRLLALVLVLASFATTQEIRRPTVETVSSAATSCSGVVGTALGMANFYDAGGEATSSLVLGPTPTSSVPVKYKQAIISGWQAPSGAYSALALKVRSSCSSNTGIPRCMVQYSTNGGSSWQDIEDTSWDLITDTIALPTSQDLSQLKIRYCVESYWDPFTGIDRGSLTGYDIRTEGNLAPLPPSNLSANSAANGLSVTLAWTDNSANESGFKIDRCTGSGCTNFAFMASVGANVTSLVDPTSACTTYNYRAYAFNGGGSSLFSNTAQVGTTCGPNSPSGLSVIGASTTSITLSWTDVSGETSYSLEQCQGATCSNFTEVATPAANTTTYTDPGLTPNATYTYRIRARNGAGFSGYSNTVVGVAQDMFTLNTPYTTKYVYNGLDRLLCVEQHGNKSSTGCAAAESSDATSLWRVRRFEYNTLGKLLRAKNPELGVIAYLYDDDGNTTHKVDARGVDITYAYDALHRLTGKTYTGITETAVTYNYDEPTAFGLTVQNRIGHRTSMSDASGTTGWSYDVMGQVLVEKRTIAGQTKEIDYAYNLDGSIDFVKYPCPTAACTSQRRVNFSYNTSGANAAGRLQAVIDADGTQYVSAATYYASGDLKSAKYGVATGFAGITVNHTLNNRLQPSLLEAQAPSQTLLSLTYNFGLGVSDNGNVYGITNNRVSARSMAFTYDALNRLATAYTPSANTWGNKFQIDPWGNLEKMLPLDTFPIAQNLNQVADLNNRIIGFCYDAAGNLLRQNSCGANDYIYDGESRIKTTAGVDYTYDGDGVRVKKTGTTPTLYWKTNFLTGPLAESDAAGNVSKEFIYFNGNRIARRDTSAGAVHYLFSDHLGSANVVSNATGTAIEEESDFYPFGGERVVTDTIANQNYKFTGKERDTESGLDYFGARYYASNVGRWLTPDWSRAPEAIPYASIQQPQSLNLYAYGRDNPIARIDPDGHRLVCHGSLSTDKGLVLTLSCHDEPDPPAKDKGDATAAIGAAVGHHYIPKQLWQHIAKNSRTWQLLNSWVTGPLKDSTVNKFDRLHRLLNKAMEQLIKNFEKNLGKSMKDFEKGDWEQLASRVERAGGDIEAFNERLAAANPEAMSMRESLAEAFTELGEAAVTDAAAGAVIAEEAAAAAAESGIIPP